MRSTRFNLGIFFLLFALLPIQVSAESARSFELNYLASYKGVFSLFNSMDIADVNYSVESILFENQADKQVNNQISGTKQIRLTVSSENFATVEKLYPFRYLFKSFFRPATATTHYFEHLKTTKKSRKKKHQVGILDHIQKKVQLFKSTEFEELITPGNFDRLSGQKLEFVSNDLKLKPKSEPISNMPHMPIDRMTMLELMSEQVKQKIKDKDYLVTNGDELFRYRVSFLDRHDYQFGKRIIPSQKLKVEAFDLNPETQVEFAEYQESFKDGFIGQVQAGEKKPDYAHAPVYAWFSLTEKPFALKFVNHHAVGDFIIEIVADQGLVPINF